MKNSTFRQLKIFETVARHRSYSRAAEELHLTQPAVSTQVAKLEEHAGVPLFEQLGKKIYLTPAGAEMAEFCKSIALQFQNIEDAMAQFKDIRGGTLNIGVISAGDYFFPRLLVQFTRSHPEIKLNLTVHNREELLRVLTDNLTDMAVMVRPPLEMDTINEPFAPHPYVIVAAPDHPLVSKRNIPIEQIEREPFIVRERGSDTWNSMEEAFDGRMERLNIVMEVKSTETIKQAVIAGMGLSFLSAHTISLELQTGSLNILDVVGFPVMLHWYIVHRKDKRLPPVAKAFRDFLMQHGAAHIEDITQVNRSLKKPIKSPMAKGRGKNAIPGALPDGK